MEDHIPTTPEDRAKWPGIESPDAMQLAIASYTWMLARFEAVQGSLDKLIGWATTLTGGFIAYGLQQKLQTGSVWFFIATVLFVAAVVICFVAKLQGGLSLHDPGKMWQNEMDRDVHDMKRVIFTGAKNSFRDNIAVIHAKWRMQVIALVLFCLEAVALVIWSRP